MSEGTKKKNYPHNPPCLPQSLRGGTEQLPCPWTYRRERDGGDGPTFGLQTRRSAPTSPDPDVSATGPVPWEYVAGLGPDPACTGECRSTDTSTQFPTLPKEEWEERYS